MFDKEGFEQWCWRLGLSDQAKTVITQIRMSPPARHVQSSAGNVSGTYPSIKMGCSIQFESHHDELPFVYLMDHDPQVLEFYDQPAGPPIKLKYRNQDDTRNVTTRHTPDFFVLHEDRAGWVECKMEDDLVRLAKKMPFRYQHRPDGSWFCPPGEAYAAQFDLTYRLFSSREIDWTYIENLRFLGDYLRGSPPPVSSDIALALRTTVMSQPGIRLLNLIATLHRGKADAIYQLILTDQLYVDLQAVRLTDYEHVQVFLDREQAESYAILQPTSTSLPRPSAMQLTIGASIVLDGKAWTIFNPGATEVLLLSEDKQVMPVPNDAFEELIHSGRLTGLIQTAAPPKSEEGRELLAQASPADLEEANHRYAIITETNGSTKTPVRTVRRWRAQWSEALASYGNGFIGLLPQVKSRGNRRSRLDERTEALIETFITEHYETLKQQSKKAVFLLLQREAERRKIPAPSYPTFLDRLKSRPLVEQTRKRKGPRAAAQVEEWHWELELTTPRHGSRPLDVVHLDHTELDIELVSARTGRPLGRPWVTFLTDAFSRRLLAVYLTFDPPSYRSCMMTLRECVSRYGRLPQTIVVDGGPDFHSTYFETLVTYYGCEKKTRPGAKPRYGSVIERLFGTANTQFVYNLIGNTQIMKQVRQVTKSIAPREQAIWTLGDVYAYLCLWAYQVYDQQIHPALGMSPRDAFKMGIARGGAREHLQALYDDDFRYLSLPSTRKKTAQVKLGRGVKINYVYYRAKALDVREVENQQVPVRYDPFDLGTAYAYVQGRWVQARSEHYLQLRGHSERELQLASAELHKQHRNHTRDSAITAKRLADLFADLSSYETVLSQHWHDAEARDVFVQMEDQMLPAQFSDLEERVPVLALVQTESASEQTNQDTPKTKRSSQYQPAAIIEDDVDLEDLEEFEEYH
jgi:transposase InsO family protein